MDVKRGISGYLVASLLLHLIIGIILLVGVDFSKPKRPESKGQIVNAVMLDSEILEQQMQQIQQQKQPSPRLHSSRRTRKTPSAKRELAQEQERLRIAETKRKQAEEATRKAEPRSRRR
jgi:colicin import membrane protein